MLMAHLIGLDEDIPVYIPVSDEIGTVVSSKTHLSLLKFINNHLSANVV